MKAYTALAIALLVGAAGSPACCQGQLQNPDFETGPPPGPGVATNWATYSVTPGAIFYVMGTTSTPWAVYSGDKSQMWMAPVGQQGGIYQIVTGVTPGRQYVASVYFGDPDPLGPYGPTRFRIGIHPSGVPPTTPGMVWGAWQNVISAWQLAEVEATISVPQLTVAIESAYGSGGGPPYQHSAPANRTIVDGAKLVPKWKVIAGVPDANQPPDDPLGTGDVTNYCGGMATVNITGYYDAPGKCPGINAGLPLTTAAAYLGYWLDTNDDGCPFRLNGLNAAGYPSTSGTYLADLAPGLAQYARWDANNKFGCTPPPNLPAGKTGYSWTVVTQLRTNDNLQKLWDNLVTEIVNDRPLIVTWSYWNPIDSGVVNNGVHFWTWGASTGESGGNDPKEKWNEPSGPTAGGPLIGHMTTAVGYWKQYDHDGDGNKDDWVIVHDNWARTSVDLAIPMYTPAGWSPWAANTYVITQAPANIGAVSVAKGLNSPGNHWGCSTGRNIMCQLQVSETSGNEDALINAIGLTAQGTGDDRNDIANVYIYDDANGSGGVDAGEALIASSGAGFPADNGTMSVIVPNSTYTLAKNGTVNLLIIYDMINATPNDTFTWAGMPSVYATGKTYNLPVNLGLQWFQPCTKTISQACFIPCPRIATAKMQEDGTGVRWVGCSPVVSAGTGRFAKKIYVQDQSPDGPCGIQVYFGDETIPTIPEGVTLEFEAFVDTINGERVLVNPEIIGYHSGTMPQPLGLRNSAVGGGDYCDPGTGIGQKGIAGAVGLNNIGLLVRTCGQVVEVNPAERWFRIDDGSKYTNGQPALPKVMLPTGVSMPPMPSYVLVTGISATELDGSDLKPVILMRSVDDRQVL